MDKQSGWTRASAIDTALMYADRSLAHTLTPDSNYLLLAYLAFNSGDQIRLREYANEAVKWDPNFPNARWLMSEAYLAEGDREQAAREAEIALEINPSSLEARSVLSRARDYPEGHEKMIRELIEMGRMLAEQGNMHKAERKLVQAIRRSQGPCPDCHRALALLFEAEKRTEDAIAEWQVFLNQSPDLAISEQVPTRLEKLRTSLKH